MHPPNEPPLGSPKLAEPPHYQEPSAPSPPRPSMESPRPQAGALETSREVPAGYQQSDLGPASTFRDANHEEWSTGLCACFSDVPNCCMTCFCPCVTFGQISEIIDRGTSSCAVNGMIYALLLAIFGCACMYSCFYRRRMRQQYHMKGSGFVDCCIHCWCETCSLCQEYRELKIRGFDMNIGWHANIEKQTPGVMTAPPTQAHMRR